MSSSRFHSAFLPTTHTYARGQFSTPEQYSASLFSHTNKANYTLIHCPKHLSLPPSSYSITPRYGWCLLLSCDKCDIFWAVCTKCPNVRSRMTSRSQCNRHNAKYHPTANSTAPSDPSPNSNSDGIPCIFPYQSRLPISTLPLPSTVTLPPLPTNNPASSPPTNISQRIPLFS